MTSSHHQESIDCPACCQRKRRRPGLVWLILFIALMSTWGVARYVRGWEQRKAIAALLAIEGCQVAYDGEYAFNKQTTREQANPTVSTGSLGRMLIGCSETVLGPDSVQRCGSVEFPSQKLAEVLPQLRAMPYLRRVILIEPMERTEEEQRQIDLVKQTVRQEIELESLLSSYEFKITPERK